MLDFYAPLLPVDFLLQILFFSNYIFQNTARVSIRLGPDQARRKFGPNLSKNWLNFLHVSDYGNNRHFRKEAKAKK